MKISIHVKRKGLITNRFMSTLIPGICMNCQGVNSGKLYIYHRSFKDNTLLSGFLILIIFLSFSHLQRIVLLKNSIMNT